MKLSPDRIAILLILAGASVIAARFLFTVAPLWVGLPFSALGIGCAIAAFIGSK